MTLDGVRAHVEVIGGAGLSAGSVTDREGIKILECAGRANSDNFQYIFCNIKPLTPANEIYLDVNKYFIRVSDFMF